MSTVTILPGDCRQTLATLPAESVQCCITSPPYYGLRDYGCAGQMGLEHTPEAFVAELVAVFHEVRRVLKNDGTLWLNLGDSYANDTKWGGATSGKHAKGLHGTGGIGRNRHLTNLPSKNLIGIPWRVAFALQADGWILRSDIIWHKPNPMPESIIDRPTKSHEYLFLFAKSSSYFYDAEAIKEPTSPTSCGSRKEFRGGGSYTNGNSFDNSAAIPNATSGNRKVRVPAGWKTGPGSHGTIHSEGRAPVVEYAPERPQLVRARELAEAAGLTQVHFDAIRACGLGDAGKNAAIQTGTGKNDPAVQALADHAKSVLGGYYREFLLSDRRNKRDVWTVEEDEWEQFQRWKAEHASDPKDVWTVATKPYKGAHFATFPPDLIRPCILAGSRGGDVILDPFGGSGTTGQVALEEGRRAVLCELNTDYLELIRQRCHITPGFAFPESEVAR